MISQDIFTPLFQACLLVNSKSFRMLCTYQALYVYQEHSITFQTSLYLCNICCLQILQSFSFFQLNNNVDNIYFFFASLTIILAGVNCKVANKYNLRFINLQIYFGLFLKFGKNRNALLDGEKITSNLRNSKECNTLF